MFSWSIAKSAEAMFSRWAIKRICKFFLKKKLGQFIIGDIDLDQLHVQLATGTINLSDLVLNVDYINQKLGTSSAVIFREGSIGSLSITMPWKGTGCQIEVDELELVLTPYLGNICKAEPETSGSNHDNHHINHHNNHHINHHEHDIVDKAVITASMDVHEGVKTIAKMVKWLLTSFSFKIRKLIVAFDPLGVERTKGSCRALVLRITEAECGTCISEDFKPADNVAPDDFLASSLLTNFVKFQGAVLEFLQTDEIGKQSPSASGTFAESFSGCQQPNAIIPIIMGEQGGFSGTLKLNIPWKNGSLDIRRVDADAYIDPLEIKFQPNSIQCVLYLWDIFKVVDKNGKSYVNQKVAESIYYTAASYGNSSCLSSSALDIDSDLKNHEKFSVDCFSLMEKETVADSLLPESHFIADWVPSFISRNQEGRIEEEPDFGASMDQFFECFDGLRNSQSALGNSGVWNWTCSVFSAITAATNLASGSLKIPIDEQHVETNLRITVSGISFYLSFIDMDQMPSRDFKLDRETHGLPIHYIDAKFQDSHFVMRVDRQGMDFEARVEHIEIADNYGDKNEVVDVHFSCKNIVEHRVSCIQQMQAAVEGALPSFLSLGKQGETAKVPCDSTTIQKGIFGDDVIRVKLLRTSGITQCKINLQSGSSDDNFMRPTSFTLRLPPFIFWVNFSLLGSLLDLLKEIGKSCRGVASEALNHDLKPSSQGVVGERSYSRFKNLSARESFKGNIFLLKARIILCFPFKSDGDFRSYFSWNQFIALDVFLSSTSSETEIKATNGSSIASSKKRYGSAMSCSLYLNVGDLSIYLITSLSEEDVESSSPVLTKLKCFSECVLFAKNQTGSLSGISVLWPESPVTGPWIAKKGKILASFDDARGRHKFMRKGYEFASVTTVKDIEDFTARSKKEMILSSTIFLHSHLSSVAVDVSRSQYERLRHLMDQMIDFLSCIASDTVSQLPSASQVSIIMECDSTAVSITTEAVENIKSSIQNELPGSWHGFRLEVQKLELLYVSNIGGIKDANFFSVAHGEGNLWGSISEVPKKELLLISCNDSTIGRGDGQGSNVLSSKYSGSDIVFLWDPQRNQSHTSITVRSGTIVAVGGRLDWLDPLSSFFIVLFSEVEQAGDDSLVKENESSGSFILNLVDIGLSYEPYFENQKQSDSGSGSVNVGERSCEQNVACLFAASSLKVSNVGSTDSIVKNYKIRVQDLGLLLCPVSQHRNIVGTYSVEHLHNIGYLKVAEEAHVEALFRMNSNNCPIWEVECSESHIVLNTCHDTAFGLIRLVAQLQQLFSPELEESVMHLQTRWNNVQQAQECDESRFCSSASSSQVPPSSLNTMSKNGVNLMDEICEDAFHLDGHWEAQSDFGLFGGMNDSSVSDAESFPHNLSLTGPMSVAGLEKSPISDPQRSFPEFIEGYFLSEPPEPSLNNRSSNGMFKCNSRETDREVQRGKSGWYRDSSLTVLENHAELTEQKDPLLVHSMVPSSHTPDDFGKVNGHLFFKNINVIWKMYAGSDWQHFDGHDNDSVTSHGRDTTVCFELELSGMDFQYDIFPDGGISASRLLLSIQNFQLNDNSKDAPWKLVLGYYQSKRHPRESSSKSFKLDLEAVRPDPSIPLEEYRLRVAFLPMRLHLHQCHLDFLINFFGGKDSPVDKSPSVHSSGVVEIQTKKKANFGDHTIVEEALLPYFQKFDIWPVVLLVDYSPHHVDLAALRGGKYVELINLVPWKGVELHLKHVQSVGVYGWSCVGETIIGEWLEDISENQIHKLLKGLPPIRSLVAVSSGAAKLVSTPLKNYRKDHRLIKGMQRGVIAFLRSISSEAIGLGVHLAASTHEILFQAECLLTNISSPLSWPVQSRTTTDVRSNQPKDAQHGIQQAYDCVSDGLGKSASIFRGPIKKYQRGAGVGSAIVTAVQAAPAAAIAPASAVACAMHCTLLGVRNSLDPEHKKESVDKYTGRSHPESP